MTEGWLLWLRRVWPDTIALRMATVAALALAAVLPAGMVAYLHDRAETAHRIFLNSTVEQIIAMVDVLDRPSWIARQIEALDPDDPDDKELKELLEDRRVDGILRRAKRDLSRGFGYGSTFRFNTSRKLPPFPDATKAVQELVKEHLGERLGAREMSVLAPTDPPPRRRDRKYLLPSDGQRDLLPSRIKAIVAVKLKMGIRSRERWALFSVTTDIASTGWVWRTAGWMVAGALFVVVFVAWASQLVTGSIRRFSERAHGIAGEFIVERRVPETGPREVKQAARAYNRMLSKLLLRREELISILGATSHEMRSALVRFGMRIEFIGDDAQRDGASADLSRVLAILDAVYAFAREETAAELYDSFDLASMARTLCDDVADDGAAARYRGPDRLVLRSAPQAVRRALANLIDNAIKYGGEADVRLVEGDEYVQLIVGDRGPGIPQDQRYSAFEPFQRLEVSPGVETPGMGLGLWIARSSVTRGGGTIDLGAREGGGLEAVVTLPKPGTGR